MGAVRARVSRTRSAGGSSTCRPRFPALTMTVANCSADSSTTVGSCLPLTQRADAAEDVAGGPLGVGRIGHHGLAPAGRRGQRLEVEGAATGTIGDGQFAVDPGHECLEHLARIGAERGHGCLAVPLVGGVLRVVGVQGVRHLGLLQDPHRRSRRHGAAA